MAGSRIDRTATRLLSRASIRAQNIRMRAFAAAGSSGYFCRLLASMADEGSASQTVLSRRTGIDPSDVTAAINELTRQGFVERTRDPSDARRNVVTVTESGEKELGRLDKVVADIQEEFLAPLSPTERQQLLRILTKLTDADPGR